MTEPVAEIPIETIIEKYVALRDKKSELTAEYKQSVEKLDAGMDRCEAFLMATMQRIGVDSFKTKFGTAYKTTKTSAQVADWDSVLGFIREGGYWSMLTKNVSKDFVKAYQAEHNDLPPGINWRVETAINIKRD